MGQETRQGPCETMREEKGAKGLSLVGNEAVSCGFGLRTGDPSDTAVGVTDCRRPAHPSMDDWEEPGV